MKINMILPGANHSGGVQMAFEYLDYFVKMGADVICYVPIKTLIKAGINSDSLGKWYKSTFKIKFIPFFNNMTIRNADVTIATSWITSYWVYALSPKKGKKVYFIQDYETWFKDNKNRRVRKSYHLPMDLRVSVSTELQKKLQMLDNCDSEVICNGIKEKYLRTSYKKNKNNESPIVIGMPYREKKGNSDVKNCEFGIKALKKIQLENSNLQVQLFGFKKPKNLPTGMHFLENPSRTELMKWYDSVDILYIPSIYEGWGLPAMEGMARGCVVIGSNTGCLKEFGKNKLNCIKLNDMKSMNQITHTVQMLIENKNMIYKISKSALNTVRSYTFEKYANNFWNQLIKLV